MGFILDLVPSVIAAVSAIVVGAISAAVSIITSRKAARLQRELEEFKAEWSERAAERSARRSYEYEARQRLYQQYEPLRFQLGEAAEGAYSRILSLARSCRNGDLRRDGGWNSREGYYLRSIIYKLLLPMAIFRLMQRMLTLVDLGLDAEIGTQYKIAKALYYSWTDDFELAGINPSLKYTPQAELGSPIREVQPSVYLQQGIPTGYLDRSVEAFLSVDESKLMRTISYGEFEKAFRDKESETYKANIVFVKALLNFHPATRPVLWRILIAQICLYRLLIGVPAADLFKLSDEKRGQFDWRRTSSEASDEEALTVPFEAARQYLKSHGLLDVNLNSPRRIRI